MKIGMQTWGSHGDIRPFMALADGLQCAGHDVTLVVTCVDSDRYVALVSSVRYRLQIVATPVIVDKQLLEKIGDALLRERNAIRQTQLAIEQLLLPAEPEMFRVSERLCIENELVIGHYFLYTLGAAAERHGSRYVSVALGHGGVPSRFQPPSGVPGLGSLGNRLAWWAARYVLNRSIKQYPDRLRSRHGIRAARDVIDNVWASGQLTLLAISPALCRPRSDWPDHYQICGALDAHGSVAEGSVPEALRTFLDGGAPPAYMTFGSMMSGSSEQQTVAMLSEAARAASVRAIIQAPHWHQLGFESGGDIHYVESAPHAEVFPQCALIVHHGGAGTSHAALRAGKPSVVVAHTAEQELWGRELERVGAASRLLRRRRVTAGEIAVTIERVARSQPIASKATELGAIVASEDGVATAVRLIGAMFANPAKGERQRAGAIDADNRLR